MAAQAKIRLTQDFANKKAGQVLDISFETAHQLVHREIAVYHKEGVEKTTKPEVTKNTPPVNQTKKQKKNEKTI